MSKSTLILIIILFLIAGGLLTLALNKSFSNPTQVNELPIPSINPVAPETSLLFGNLDIASPSSYPKTYSLPILIKTGVNKVTAVQLELAFDSNILTNLNITPSTFFTNPNVIINKINSDTGRISYALSASNPAPDGAGSNAAAAITASESAKQGNGTIATITFESLISSVSSAITFLPRTFVTAEGFNSSALKSTNSAQFLLE